MTCTLCRRPYRNGVPDAVADRPISSCRAVRLAIDISFYDTRTKRRVRSAVCQNCRFLIHNGAVNALEFILLPDPV